MRAQNNGEGTVGWLQMHELYAVKVLDKIGEGNQSDVAKGVEWAIGQKLDIINLSITSENGSHIIRTNLTKSL